jgi:hypothetical protein
MCKYQACTLCGSKMIANFVQGICKHCSRFIKPHLLKLIHKSLVSVGNHNSNLVASICRHSSPGATTPTHAVWD